MSTIPQTQPQNRKQVRNITCPMLRKTISREECQDYSSDQETNVNHCTRLQCPMTSRLCWACIPFKVKSLVSNHKEGLCEFHLKHGFQAEPPFRANVVRLPTKANSTATTEPTTTVVPKNEPSRKESPAPAGFEHYIAPPEGMERLAEAVTKLKGVRLEMIHWSLISPMVGQPRWFFDSEKMDFLRTTMQDYGQQQAVTVTKDPDNLGRYVLVDGERRWRSAKTDDRDVLCMILEKELSDDERFLLSTLANMHRAEHTTLEKAYAMRRLQKMNMTQKQIANIFGCSYGTVGNHLLVLDKLHPAVLDLLDPIKHEKTLGLMVATELTAFYDYPERQLYLARNIIGRKMTTQQAKRYLQKEAKKANIQVGRGRERKPSDYLESLTSILIRIEFGLDPLLSMKRHEFEDRFKHLTLSELKNMAEKIGCGAESLSAIQDFFDTLIQKLSK